MAVIDQYFKYLVEAGGSDLHLSEGQPPKIRVNGTISAISDENLEGQAFKNLLAEICDPQAFQKYLEEGDLDFAYEMMKHPVSAATISNSSTAWGLFSVSFPPK